MPAALNDHILGRFDADRLHFAFSLRLQRTDFEIREDIGPTVASGSVFIPPLSIRGIGAIQIHRQIRVKDILVESADTRGKMRWSIEHSEDPMRTDLPDPVRRIALILRQPAMGPVALWRVFGSLAGDFAPAVTS